ncbi:hypothetical protein BO71DRAFT_450516 [Aspergillus ellipticus CBS 707.79]|uniref:3-oxo-5-alpha-steroid 4-dehydrogenase C-terminal domain-containing protein n=1 Tax=Aspergillus ellipticus CBS 707.79 TaxID=1448320 RepID=A0A319D9A3_9EURO|nr:hypothetical protein BO71DRAFT_450516 [Aspergillus ellipticus CBS 707.79]
MGSLLSSPEHLPPLADFILPTPETYTILVNIFQYFPVVSIIQWLTSFHPAGKTSMKTSRLNLPGRWAWFAMEIVSPLNLIFILWTNSGPQTLPLPNKLLASLYTLHYINRAIISPLFAAPSMSPIHLVIMSSAMLFNWLNSSCLAAWLLGYHIPIPILQTPSTITHTHTPIILPTLGLLLFLTGMACNIHSERTLFRLRREAATLQEAKKSDSDPHTKNPPNKYSKLYIMPPPTGLFTSILYPHYVAEWLEWLGFALLGTAVFPTASLLSSSSLSSTSLSSGVIGVAAASTISTRPLHLAPWLLPAASLAQTLNVPLPLPAVVFLVNAVTNMLPHARWGRKWYVERFGEGMVAGRGAVVPFFRWL